MASAIKAASLAAAAAVGAGAAIGVNALTDNAGSSTEHPGITNLAPLSDVLANFDDPPTSYGQTYGNLQRTVILKGYLCDIWIGVPISDTTDSPQYFVCLFRPPAKFKPPVKAPAKVITTPSTTDTTTTTP